jgi:hypothetical protein
MGAAMKKIAHHMILCVVAMLCAVPAAMGNHYILPCDSNCQDASSIIGPATTGAWGIPGQGSYDFMLEVLPGQPAVLSAAWLTFSPEGGPMWIVARGPASGNHATLSAYRGVGVPGSFPANSNPANFQLVYWGTLTIMFADCNNGHVSWSASGTFATGDTDIVRLTLPAGLACKSTAQSVPGDTPNANLQSAPGDQQQP